MITGRRADDAHTPRQSTRHSLARHSAWQQPKPCFFAESDYQRYLGDLKDAADRNECRLHPYRELFRSHIEPDRIHAIREALNQELVLGRDEFKDKIERMSARQTRSGRSGRPRAQGAEEAAGDYYVL